MAGVEVAGVEVGVSVYPFNVGTDVAGAELVGPLLGLLEGHSVAGKAVAGLIVVGNMVFGKELGACATGLAVGPSVNAAKEGILVGNDEGMSVGSRLGEEVGAAKVGALLVGKPVGFPAATYDAY